MDYESGSNETRTNAEQSETGGDFRVSYESDAWQIMDDWCRAQCQKLLGQTNPHILKGRDLNDREFRRLLGQSQAFLKMRSFIHGSRPNPRTPASQED